MEYKVVYGIKKGETHEMLGLPCQDSIYKKIIDDRIAVALCDGAGSVEESKYASNFISKTIVEDFINNTESWFSLKDGDLRNRIIEKTEKQIILDANGDKHGDCTLIFFGQYKNKSIIIHIGDGIVLGVSDKKTSVLSKPENGESINETYFLSHPFALEHLRIYNDIPEEYKTIILSSDGAEHMLYDLSEDKEANVTKKMAEWLTEDNLDEANEALDSAINNVFRNYTNDDISIALIKRS